MSTSGAELTINVSKSMSVATNRFKLKDVRPSCTFGTGPVVY